MSSVPKQLTNIDFIVSAGWLPQKCSVCDTTVEFAWEGDPLFCQRCVAWAPEDIRIRLLRVQDVRSLLGFGEDDAGTSVRRALHTLESDPPPVIGHPVKDVQLPFMDRPLVPGSAYEMYCVHGLSRWASDDLNNNTTLKSTALRYEATPAPVWAIAHHNRTMDGIAKQCASAGEESLHFEPPQSEVLVLLG